MTESSLRAFGADRVEAGPDGRILLTCPANKFWTPRKKKTLTSAPHPGTAVAWEDVIFEVVDAEHLPDGGVRYRLAPWEEGHAIRRMEQYSEESERARQREWSDRAAGVRKRRLSILFAPLAGLLPGAVQKEMESEFGAPALAMTTSSALPLAAIGFLGLFEHLIGGLGGGLGLAWWLAPPFPIAIYLFAESALRLASAVAQGEPMGSLPVVIVYELLHPTKRSGVPERTDSALEHAALDRFKMLEPLLSLLSPSEQRLLAQRFPFDPLRWGKVTAGVLFLVAGSNVLVSMLDIVVGHTGPPDVLWLLAGGFLSFEQIRRWRLLSAGEPAGSVLGALIRPLAKPLFVEPRSVRTETP